MWRHIQNVRPLVMPDRIEAVERLLAATAEPGGERCSLTAFIEAFRRHHVMPVLDGERWAALRVPPGTGVQRSDGRSRGAERRVMTPRRGARHEMEDVMATNKAEIVLSLTHGDEAVREYARQLLGHRRRG